MNKLIFEIYKKNGIPIINIDTRNIAKWADMDHQIILKLIDDNVFKFNLLGIIECNIENIKLNVNTGQEVYKIIRQLERFIILNYNQLMLLIVLLKRIKIK